MCSCLRRPAVLVRAFALSLLLSLASAVPPQSIAAPAVVARMGSVDLGILAETTPVVWRDALWLMECIQGGRYYGNINSATYPNQPQPSGYLRFTNVVTGEHTKPFAEGYGLANALVLGGRMYVFATVTPFAISSNNTLVATFWSDDLTHWQRSIALRAEQPNVFPPAVTARKLYNTNVRQVPDDDEEARISANNATFVMAYEFNEPGVGWQTGFAQTHDSDLRKASWECLPRPAFTSSFARYAHANPTLRYGKDGWWYLLSTRRTNSSSLGSGEKKEVMVQDVLRTKDITKFEWESPASWRPDVVTQGTFLAPSHEDQLPLRNDWHPDTQPVVRGHAVALAKAENDNVSDLDMCTITLPDGRPATLMYYAWGNQELGPTAMVLSMAMVKGQTEEEVLAAHFAK